MCCLSKKDGDCVINLYQPTVEEAEQGLAEMSSAPRSLFYTALRRRW